MYDQLVRKPFWRRVQEGPLFRKQFVERGKLGVVYGVDGLLRRFLEPGCNPRLRRWQEVRVGDISTDPLIIEETVAGLSQDGFAFGVQVRVTISFVPRLCPDRAFRALVVEKLLDDERWLVRAVIRPLIGKTVLNALVKITGTQLLLGQVRDTLEHAIAQNLANEALAMGLSMDKLLLQRIVPPEELLEIRMEGMRLWANAMETYGIPAQAWERLMELLTSMRTASPSPSASTAAGQPPPPPYGKPNGMHNNGRPYYSARP